MARRQITILCGPNGSARSNQIDTRLQESKGTARLLVPSVQQARMRREHFFRAEGCEGAWGVPVLSLTDFAEDLMAQEGIVVTRLDSAFQQRLLMEHCLKEIAVDLPETSLVRIRPTPGLVRHLVTVVNDLKQAAVEPDDFRKCLEKVAHHAVLDEGVAAVYTLYQEAMQGDGLYDVPGLYWHANYLATQGRPRILAGVSTLIWDGFDDFTPSEFRLLQSLAAQVDSVVIGLNLDPAPDRQDRYALSLDTLRALQEHFDCQVVECEASEARSYVDFAARHIFWREAPTLPENLNANLSILPCSDTIHEVERIGRRIKGLIVEEGVRPDQIAVVYWKIAPVADVLRSTFAEFQIPCTITTARPLGETRLGRTLMSLLSGADDWARGAVLDLLFSPWLQGVLGDKVPQAASYYACRAGILDGYRNWEKRLSRLHQKLERGEGMDVKGILSRLPKAADEVASLLDVIGALRAFQDRLPAKGTQHAYALEIDDLLTDLKLREGLAMLSKSMAPLEEEAIQGIQNLLLLLADAPGSDMVPLAREEFLTRFEQGMSEISVKEKGASGGVQCVDAAQVRNQRYDHVFFAGLVEGQVPAPPAGNAVYPERDRERLQEAGIPIEGNQAHHARQRMLFGHVLECAEKSLHLSWPVTQGGRESSPSPFLTDVRELFPASTGAMRPYPKADSFLPSVPELASGWDLVNRALFDSPALVEAFPEYCAHAQVGVAVEKERQLPCAFGAYDGVLGSSDLVAAIARYYGVEHEFSVNQLESYIGCPFNFYMQRILHLEEISVPDGSVEAMMRGNLLHEVLHRFHRTFTGLHIRDIGLEKAEKTMGTLVDEVFDNNDWSESSAPRGAIAGEKANLLTRLHRYLRVEHAKDDEQCWKPLHFEVAFGRAARKEEDPLSTSEAYAMKTEAGMVRFTGRIDRIDQSGDEARIIDYKSGGTPGSGDITSGRSLQLSVYAKAVEEQLLPDSECTEACYIPVGKEKYQDGLGIGKKRDWPNREENMKRAIEKAVAGIRRGYFPPVRSGSSCYGCGNARACRHDESRMARKEGMNSE